jgi:DHA2 family multidrug resistance protein
MSSQAPAKAGAGRWLIAVSVALGALLEIVDTSIVNVALTQMQASLGVTLSEVGWVVTSYGIANVIILPLAAWLSDRFGKKRFFVFSLAAFTVASMMCGFANSLWTLVFARVLQGLFGGGLLAKAQSILFETFPKEEQPMAQALFGIVAIAGPAIGPTLGGYIVTNLDWRWIFFINLPIGLIAVMMTMASLPPDDATKKAKGAIDFLSIAYLAIGLGSLQTVLEEGYSEDWFDSPLILGMTITSAVALVLFVRRTLRAEHPVVDLRVLRYRSLAAGNVLSMVIGMGLYGAMFAVPIFAQSILHFTSQQTGMLMLPGALVSAFTMPIVARLLRKFDPRFLIFCGGAIVVTAMSMLASMNAQTGEGDLFWPLVIRGFGTVMMFLPMSMAVLGPIPVKDIAAATGLYNLTRQLGGSLGIAILTTLLSSRQAFHRAVLVEKLGISDLATQTRLAQLTAGFQASGADPVAAKGRALAVMDGAVSMQAAVMSFGDTFYFGGAAFVVALPLLFLLGRGKSGQAVDAGH